MRRDGKSTILEEHVNDYGNVFNTIVHEQELSGEWEELNEFVKKYETKKVA